MLVDIEPEDIDPMDIELELAQLTSVCRSSLNRCQMFSPIATDMLCSVSRCGLLIDKIYSIDWLAHL